MFRRNGMFEGAITGMFGNSTAVFGLAQLQSDPNCVLIQDPSAIWGGSDHLPRRNLLTYSEDFSNAAWLQATYSAALSATSNPFGGAAFDITQGATGAVCQNFACSANTNYVFTLYAQRGTATDWKISIVDVTGGFAVIYPITSRYADINGSTWTRLTIPFTTPSGCVSARVYVTRDTGTTGTVKVCCPQVTLASTLDQSYQRITDWVTEQYAWAAQKNAPWLRRNRFLNTATLSTQTVTAVTANPITVSFTGTGKIDFTTAYTGTLQGTGASDRVTATFTPAAGNLVCTVTGTVTLAQCEVGSTATPYQAIGASWAATYTSLALAAGYPISLYSDRAGTTATVGPDDQVGVLLDGSEGLSKLDQSSQLLPILSGYFDGAGPSDGQLNAPGGTYRSTQWFPVTAGGWYLLRSDGNRARWRFKTSTGTVFSFLDGYNVVVAPTTAAFAQVYFTADNVYSYLSVYSVPGYHAIAPSVAGSPTLRLDGNGRWYLDRDTTDDALAITWPANFTTTAVQYVADQATTTETTGITLNGATSYTTPQRPTGDYGRIIFKTPTTYSAKVLKYLAGKAGR